MCIVFVSIEAKPRYKYVILSNRDEDFSRPTLSSHFWAPNSSPVPQTSPSSSPSPSSTTSLLIPSSSTPSGSSGVIEILAGRDATRGGTWLGISRTGRFAVVTNFQERPLPSQEDSEIGRIRSPSLLSDFKSRGDLPTDFLAYEFNSGDTPSLSFFQVSQNRIPWNARSSLSPEDYLKGVREEKDKYPGFSLIVGDCEGLYLFSNRDPSNEVRRLETGSTIGLTNSLLDGGWFKEVHGVSLAQTVVSPDPDMIAELATECDFRTTGASTSASLDQALQPLLDILTNNEKPPSYPDEALDIYARAGEMAPIFVDRVNTTPSASDAHFYGTRCNIILLVDYNNRVTFYERSLETTTFEWKTRVHHFLAQP